MSNFHLNEIFKKSTLTLITKGAGIGLNFLLLFLITKKLGKDSLGDYTIAITSLSAFVVFFSLGLNFSITTILAQAITNKRNINLLYKKVFFYLVLLSLIGGLGIFFLSNPISIFFYKNQNYVEIIQFTSYLVPFYVITIFNIEFLKSFKNIKVSETLRNIGFSFLTIIFILILNSNKNVAIYSFGISVLFLFFISEFFVLKELKKYSENNILKSSVFSKNEILKPSTPLLIMGISAFVLSETGIFILKYFHSSVEVGDYTILYKISLFSSLVFITISTILGPKISELFWEEKKHELYKIMIKVTKIIFILSLPITVVLVLYSDFFLEIFSVSSDYRMSFIILTVGQFIYGFLGVSVVYLMVTDKQKVFRNIYCFSSLVNIVLTVTLIPKYKVLGAAIAISISHICLVLICNIYLFNQKINK